MVFTVATTFSHPRLLLQAQTSCRSALIKQITADLGEGEAVEVAQETVGDGGAAAAGGPHGRHELHVGQRAEGRVAAVPAPLPQRLPQQLHRRLRAPRKGLVLGLRS